MKNSTIKSAFAATVALAAMNVLSSCQNDDFDDVTKQAQATQIAQAAQTTETRAAAATEKTIDSKYYPGYKMSRQVDNYGFVEFTCISNKAPYYFVHTSSRQYSPAEKDKISYQQNQYAVDMPTLKIIADKAVNEWAMTALGAKYTENGKNVWKEEAIDNFAADFHNAFQNPGLRGKYYSRTDKRDFYSDDYWIKSDKDYEYGYFYMVANANADNELQFYDHEYWNYLTASSHFLIYAFTVE